MADIGGANPANSPDTLYLTLVDSANKSKTIVHPDPKATCVADWTQWRIPLKDLAGVNAAAIKKMTIGIGSRSSPKAGAAGRIYIDDIQYGTPIMPVGLVAHFKLEGDTLDSSGNGHDGVLAGNAAFPVSYVDGPAGLGKAMLFEGTGGHQYVDLGTFNPSEKTGKLTVALWAKWDGLSTAWQGLIGKRTNTWAASAMMWQIEANQTNGVASLPEGRQRRRLAVHRSGGRPVDSHRRDLRRDDRTGLHQRRQDGASRVLLRLQPRGALAVRGRHRRRRQLVQWHAG